MILIRTTAFDQTTADFASTLSKASGREAAILVDERAKTVDTGTFAKVSITVNVCRDIGLFTPDDFTWRCGDYGFYLARRRFPDIQSFWIIETDVLVSGPELFFRCMDAHPHIDLLAANLTPAGLDWWWYGSATSRNATQFRCLFPVVRLSVPAIDYLERTRVAHSRQWRRRVLWPNDEIFVATSLIHAGFTTADLNEFGRQVYDTSSYSYDTVIDGESLNPPPAMPFLYHSVLCGEAARRKGERVRNFSQPLPWRQRAIRKGIPKINSLLRW